MSSLELLNDELILKVCGYADTPRTLTASPYAEKKKKRAAGKPPPDGAQLFVKWADDDGSEREDGRYACVLRGGQLYGNWEEPVPFDPDDDDWRYAIPKPRGHAPKLPDGSPAAWDPVEGEWIGVTNKPGYAAAKALSVTCLAMGLVSTIYADRCETDEEAAWESLGLLEQDVIVSAANDAYRIALPVVRRCEKLEAEERSKLDRANAVFAFVTARLANPTDVLELKVGGRAKLVKITGSGGSLRYNCTLSVDVAGVGEAGQLLKLKTDQIKPEFRPLTVDTFRNNACGFSVFSNFREKPTSASLRELRRKIDEFEEGIALDCAIQVTFDEFEKDLAAFKALCEAAPTEAARLSLIAAKAKEARMLPREPIVETNRSRLRPYLDAIADAAGPGFWAGCYGPVLERADKLINRAEAELAKRPVAERRDEFVRRRRWGFSELPDKDKQDKLYQEIKVRAPAIDPADYPFTPMDAEARAAACEIERSLWSAPEGRSGRNTVASRRFQLPLCRSFDLGHLADALRDGLSFLIPTSAIEVFPLEHYVEKMEIGARIHPHLYPLARE